MTISFSGAYQKMQYGNYPDLTSVRKILIIKMRHLGDVLLATPVFSILKNRFPNAEIDALIYNDTRAMLEGNPHISTLHLYDRSKRWKLFADLYLYRKMRKEKYDLVINLTEGDKGAFVARFSKAKIRVGFEARKSGFVGKEGAFTHLVKSCPGRHAVEKNIDALRKIGIFPHEDEKKLFLTASSPVDHDPYLVIHPASRWKFKCLPEKRIAELIDQLSSVNLKIYLTCSKDPFEMQMIENILQLTHHKPVNLAGKLTLCELATLIKHAQGLITVDSVPLHMASAFKTPVVALFGPSSEGVWGPWQHPKAQVVSLPLSCRPCNLDGCGGSKRSDCLERLPIASITSALQKLHLL